LESKYPARTRIPKWPFNTPERMHLLPKGRQGSTHKVILN